MIYYISRKASQDGKAAKPMGFLGERELEYESKARNVGILSNKRKIYKGIELRLNKLNTTKISRANMNADKAI